MNDLPEKKSAGDCSRIGISPSLFRHDIRTILTYPFLAGLAYMVVSKSDRDTYIWIFLFVLLSFFVLFSGRGERKNIYLACISYIITCIGLKTIRALWTPACNFSSTVGFAGYQGYPREIDTILPVVIGACAIVCAFGLVYKESGFSFSKFLASLTRREPMCSQLPSRDNRRVRYGLLFAFSAFLFLHFFPGFLSLSEHLSRVAPWTPKWDGDNHITWTWLYQNGYSPFKDFWYPYSGRILYALSPPYAKAAVSISRFVQVEILLLALWKLWEKRPWVTPVFFLLLFFVAKGDQNIGTYFFRYGLIINIILSYSAIDEFRIRFHWTHAAFGIAVIQAFFFEPVAALAGIIAIGCVACLRFLKISREYVPYLLRSVLVQSVIPLFAFIIGIAILMRTGQLAGVVEFWAAGTDIANYAAKPAQIWKYIPLTPTHFSRFLTDAPILRGLCVFIAGMQVSVGTYNCLTEKNDFGKKAAGIFLACGVASLILIYRFVIREDWRYGPLLLMIVMSPGILFFFAKALGEGSILKRYSLLAILIGILIGISIGTNKRASLSSNIRGLPRRLSNIPNAFSMGAEDRRILFEKTFSAKAFRKYALDSIALELEQSIPDNGALFVLGDSRILYILTNQIPPYMITQYDMSPIHLQQKVVTLLKEKKPEVVAWRIKDTIFDGVPHVVRNPILWTYIIQEYSFERYVDDFAILRLNEQGPGSSDIGFWKKHLGTSIDLGHIPRFSTFNIADMKNSDVGNNKELGDFLLLHAEDVQGEFVEDGGAKKYWCNYRGGKKFSIQLGNEEHRFTVDLRFVPGKEEYTIFLDRIWFWKILQESGGGEVVLAVPPGVRGEIVRLPYDTDVLY